MTLAFSTWSFSPNRRLIAASGIVKNSLLWAEMLRPFAAKTSDAKDLIGRLIFATQFTLQFETAKSPVLLGGSCRRGSVAAPNLLQMPTSLPYANFSRSIYTIYPVALSWTAGE